MWSRSVGWTFAVISSRPRRGPVAAPRRPPMRAFRPSKRERCFRAADLRLVDLLYLVDPGRGVEVQPEQSL